MSLGSHPACRSLRVWLAGTCFFFAAQRVCAQPLSEVALIPVSVMDPTTALLATSALEAELAKSDDVPLISLHDARDRFISRSRAPQTASESDVDVLAHEARQAIEHVAFGRTEAAQNSVREVIARAERTLETLNRETSTARQILDACLSVVRGTLQLGKRELALEQATHCRRLVPDLTPSQAVHPVNVVGVLAEADALLRRMRTGQLRVLSSPESGCAVYLNGRHLGTTPFQLERAAAGEYRVQVECGRGVGRVHVVQLGDQAAQLRVDTQLDQAVTSDPRLSLHYASAGEAFRQVVSHAVQVGRELGVTDIFLVSAKKHRAELMRVQVAQGRLVGRAELHWSEQRGFAKVELDQAVATLTEARIEGTPSAETTPQVAVAEAPEPTLKPVPVPIPRTPTPKPRTAEPVLNGTSAEPARWKRVLGGTSLAMGVASFVAAAMLSLRRHERAERFALSLPGTDEYGTRYVAWKDARAMPYGLASASSLLATAGMIGLTLSFRPQSIPWWTTMLSGFAGTGLTAWGIFAVAKGGSCGAGFDLRSCSRDQELRDRGGLLLLGSVAFFALPLTQLARRALERSGQSRSRALFYAESNLRERKLLLTARLRWL